jgi:hypothetical protein
MPDLTAGYCVHCGDYGLGRYRWPIGDRAEAIDQHVGCPMSPAMVREEPTGRDIETPG